MGDPFKWNPETCGLQRPRDGFGPAPTTSESASDWRLTSGFDPLL